VSATSNARSVRNARDAILDAVVNLLEEHGYDGWQLRDVAARAKASFATIYKYFPSREILIVAAIEKWMGEHAYEAIEKPTDLLAPFDALRQAFRAIFEPWEQHPRMLQVFARASTEEGGARLGAQGAEAMDPLAGVFESFNPAFASDLSTILTNVVAGLLTRYIRDEIAVTEILATVERTLYWLECAAANDSS
jgi:TetR/AcrR family transcriptional regulator, cholesterol catabolism regulator